MNRLEQLPKIAEHQLGGLEAGQTLLCKIRIEAAEKKHKPKTAAMLRPVLAVCAALVLCVGAVAALNLGADAPAPVGDVPMLASYSAGEAVEEAAPMALAEVPRGSITMSAGMRRMSGSIFAEPENPSAGFPLITIGGATYRMLTMPAALDAQLMGDVIGRVNEFNLEPALGSSSVISNIIGYGEDVYAVQDQSALVAANVDGAMRVFQRVSYAGAAVIGTETLGDTLCNAQDVAWIELEGAGRAEGDDARSLMETLLSCADYENTAFSAGQSMQIGLHSGLVLQLMTGEDSVSACGTWSCPDFFEAFHEMVK